MKNGIKKREEKEGDAEDGKIDEWSKVGREEVGEGGDGDQWKKDKVKKRKKKKGEKKSEVERRKKWKMRGGGWKGDK